MELNEISGQIVEAAMKVHTVLGPGLLENAYEACLKHELVNRGLQVQQQVALPVVYDGINRRGYTCLRRAQEDGQSEAVAILRASGAREPDVAARSESGTSAADVLKDRRGNRPAANPVPAALRRALGVCEDCGMSDPNAMYMQRADGRRRCTACISRLGGLPDFE
jgi:hypothetical protein